MSDRNSTLGTHTRRWLFEGSVADTRSAGKKAGETAGKKARQESLRYEAERWPTSMLQAHWMPPILSQSPAIFVAKVLGLTYGGALDDR